MRPRSFSILALALMACLTLSCSEAEPGVPARIAFGEKAFDAGRVQQGAKIEHTFVLRNSGERDLRIRRLRTSCDCVVTTGGDGVVPSGATAELGASFDTAGLFGDVTRTIAVFSNDPSSPAVLLKLKADVAFDVAANPRRLYVGRVDPGEDVRMPGRVVLDSGAEVVGIDTGGTVIAARLVEPVAGSVAMRERRFQIHIQDNAPRGPFTEAVTVRTTSDSTPSLTIPVTGVVEGIS